MFVVKNERKFSSFREEEVEEVKEEEGRKRKKEEGKEGDEEEEKEEIRCEPTLLYPFVPNTPHERNAILSPPAQQVRLDQQVVQFKCAINHSILFSFECFPVILHHFCAILSNIKKKFSQAPSGAFRKQLSFSSIST